MSTYRKRFGEPLTNDEVYGYWLFVVSVLAAVAGMVLALSTESIGTTREMAFSLTGLGLAGALTGLVVGQSFHRVAKLLVYLGAAVCVAAVGWFTAVYPFEWQFGRAATTNVIALYTLGLGVITFSGVLAPVTVGQSRARSAAEAALAAARETSADREREASALRSELEEKADRIERLEAELDELSDSRDAAAAAADAASEETAAERERAADAQARLERLHESTATFQLYRDKASEWRWRLVHRNGRILADSGEGYVSRSNARRAVETVAETAGEAAVDADDGARFEVYEDAGGEHRWRLLSANNELIADGGQGYADRSAATDAVERVCEYAPDADALTVGEAAVEIYEDAGGEYRWRLRHRNGTILATGGEGYSDRSGAVEGVNGVKQNAPNTAIEEVESQ